MSLFGVRLKKTIKGLGLTQIELSQKTGLTPAAISQILIGKRDPSLSSIVAILEAVPVKFEILIKPRGL